MNNFDSFVCMKYSLLVLNILFMISGAVVISVGVYVKAHFYNYETFVDEQYLYAPDFLLALGLIIFIIAFIGWYGTLMENPCVNLTFSAFLILVFFLELAFGVAGYVMRDQAEACLLERLVYSMDKYQTNIEVKAAWDAVQTDFKCCGIDDKNDWLKRKLTIPNSCRNLLENETTTMTYENTYFEAGCLRSFGDFIREHSYDIQIVGLGLAFFQLFGVACSCYLSYGFRKGYEVI